MGKEVVYCVHCGDRIPASDFEKGRAATVLQKHYCKKCAATIVRTKPETTAPPPSDAPPAPRKIRTQRIPLADAPPRVMSSRTPFIVAAVIGVIALLLLLYVVFG